VIATLIHHPAFYFHSENLRPNHFTDKQNAYLYWALGELAKRGIENIDAYNISNILASNEAAKKHMETVPLEAIHELVDVAHLIARGSTEDYMLAAENVVESAFRRTVQKKLERCAGLCGNLSADIRKEIYALDSAMLEFATTNDVPQFRDVVETIWEEIEQRQGGSTGIPFQFPTLNRFATIDRGELFLFAASAKKGKSIMLLGCAVDLMRRGMKVLYLDSELSDKMFAPRMIAHLTGIEFSRVRSGRYSPEERQRILLAVQWLKEQNTFTHKYIPLFDERSVYTITKRVSHTQGIDVLIVDYFKGSGEGDAFGTYQELGRFVDLVKNGICGDMDIAGVGAVQATTTGKVAESDKVNRNASTIALLLDKTPEEIEADGADCGNKKLRVVLNRNGAQMTDQEYIDLHFEGNLIRYREARQHVISEPY
jgi:replicative DNA helicase